MRILVTGAAGYIGSALIRALPPDAVIATDQSEPASIIGNLAYPPFTRSLITPEIGTVFHLASLVSGGAEQNFELGTQVNLEATRDLKVVAEARTGREALARALELAPDVVIMDVGMPELAALIEAAVAPSGHTAPITATPGRSSPCPGHQAARPRRR